MQEKSEDRIVPVELVREMGCTEADFQRWLPGATKQAPIDTVRQDDGDLYIVHADAGAVEIMTSRRAPRRIAGITLPVLHVRFRFIGMDALQRQTFLTYFDHYTRRGGG
ncbi:hypothetical protein [Noviherbaspirillum sp. Root189]|uniref:hypothetical protein n=1 Tax=Noviherbaspirillum sp. Root189 TaxID=1736487 RepID=UPI00070D658C|nr:hypothetical protein [Noviherbaspirillum sp. Root189]KRB93792.1 hypothetical protein ASE07_12035 [Noviherbaspirillum sp. Root189]